MKDKKHIDELFKDRFKNFEASPSPHVWNQIQAKLQEEKEDRKVIPLWWKLGGVAALIALLFTIGSTFFNPFTTTDAITTEENDTTLPVDTNTQKDPLIHDYINKSDVASEEIENPTTTDDTSEAASEINNVNTQNAKDVVLKKAKASKNAIAVENTSEKASKIKNDKATNVDNKTSAGVNTQKDAVAATTNSETNSVKEAAKLEKDALKKNNDLIKKEVGIEETTKVVVATETETKKEINSDTQNTENTLLTKEEEAKKRSLLDAINEKNEEAVVATANNKPENRWDVAPNFAPVYYNSLGQGSSIDPSFSDNTKSGDVNFSYGVQISYNVNDRLSIRSGVSNVDLSYATGGLELGTAPVNVALKSVDYGSKETVITAVDKGTLSSMQNPNDPFSSITPKSTSGEVELIQNISYYEIPLELKYAVLTNKFGINLIGGFSTLFLGNNEVSVTAGDFNDTLGEANNLSSVSFTTNVGLGFDYKISKKLKFNIEPMFKYQLNPYTDSSVNFKPYYVGIYSGLSFKF
ncbi:outer membrane protein with beta-barrel domain [Ulvibacter sp. MAR_2010_11]|uniref:outer membrane beta-barrel protein n=1 Tax=Ulvibacter sp. MAR_2010_11 TaxID=1250229 RepID=UPI000C2C51E8|nr:outer membrane beta-barrel protein [Ulvibacter sp. MAR_2010_11]PKA82877.1 outer membrane protein with beta-barrel domain [Ulvibacter sp. MAR_2010_11]